MSDLRRHIQFGPIASREEAMDFVDRFEAGLHELAKIAPDPTNLVHVFTPGLYCRQIFMPAGTKATTRIHRYEHQFVVFGKCLVWTKEQGIHEIAGPFHGITYPDTRRILWAVEDTIWATFHPTQLTDVAEIEKELTVPHINPYLKCLTEPSSQE